MITNAEKYIEIFKKEYQGLLEIGNGFVSTFDGETTNGEVVHIPQYATDIELTTATGNTANDVVEWLTGDAEVTQRTFRTKGYLVTNVSEKFTAQSKRQGLMQDLMREINTKIGNYAAYQVGAASANVVKTTGTTSRSTSLAGSSSTVKRISEDDIINVAMKLTESNMTGTKYGLIDIEQMKDLFQIANFVQYDRTGMESRLLSGELVPIMGINFMLRTPSLRANVVYGTDTPYTDVLKNVYGVPGASTDTVSTTDVAGAIFWTSDSMYAARGLSDVYTEERPVTYAGTMFGANYTFGLDQKRSDAAGIVTLIEDLA